MAGREGVIFAFFRIRETAQAAKSSVCLKAVTTSGQQFMAVSLVPDIPHNPVIRSVEHIMQGYGQLYRSHARCEMSGMRRKRVDQKRTQLGTDFRQLVNGQPAQVGRRIYA